MKVKGRERIPIGFASLVKDFFGNGNSNSIDEEDFSKELAMIKKAEDRDIIDGYEKEVVSAENRKTGKKGKSKSSKMNLKTDLSKQETNNQLENATKEVEKERE